MVLGIQDDGRSWREQLANPICAATMLLLSLGGLTLHLVNASPRMVRIADYVIFPVIFLIGLQWLLMPKSWRLRVWLTIAALVASGLAGVSAVGLLVGGGSTLLIALIFSALLLGMRAMVPVLGVILCGVFAIAALMVSGAIPPPEPGDLAFDQANVWVRTGVAVSLLAILAGVAVARVVGHIELALARVREESARREKAQEERTRALEVAFEAQKIEMIGRLAASFAHDLNNMLLVVSTCNELLAEQQLSRQERAETHDAIASAVRQASSLTGRLMSFSRKRIASPAQISTRDLAEELRKILTRLLPGDPALSLECTSEAVVHVDALQLQQAILNLAINARDAMAVGGCLTVRVRDVEVAAPLRCIGGEIPPGRFAAFEVHDTGSGMDARTAARAFEPLFTTKPEGKGTGLGLASVLATVQASRGHVTLWSEPGRGTQIALYLPIVAEATPEAVAHPPAAPDLRGTQVLVADDSPEALRAMQRALSDAGCSVLPARDGAHALELIETSRVPVDVFCTDPLMPGVPVRDLLARLQELHPEAAVLLVSSYVTDELLRRGIEQGAYRVLAKPFTTEQLLQAIGEARMRPVRALGVERPEEATERTLAGPASWHDAAR
jgi:signal transduction histidine kinase/FixJ family two-component response regulator